VNFGLCVREFAAVGDNNRDAAPGGGPARKEVRMGTMQYFLPAIALVLLLIQVAFSDERIKKISQALDENPRGESLWPLLPELDSLVRDETTAPEALPLAEKVAAALLPTAAQTGQWPAVGSLLKSAARMRYAQAEPDNAALHLQSLLEMYRSVAELSDERTASLQANWLSEVALEYLRGGQTQSALDLIAAPADRPVVSLGPTQPAVAGALNRRLQELSTDQRYELLYAWTMPTPQRRNVRVFTALAPVDAPPDVFARALGERPRANAFPIAEVGGVPGLFSTAWLLVKAAADSGRLRRLTTELNDLRSAKLPNAEHLWLLAQVADNNLDAKEFRNLLEEQLAAGAQPAVLQWTVLAAACLDSESRSSAASKLAPPQRGAIAQMVFAALLDPG
jgi:hypothetical protein